jgi:hypothetical protein
VLASAAAGLKPFSASGAGCEYKDGEEEGEAHAAKASLEYGELMEEYAAVSATIEDNAEARLQSFDRQNTNRSFVDGVHRSAVLPLRAEDHHSLPILAHRVEVATGVARDLAVDVTTLESSIVAETAETSSYASAKSTIISTWGRAKSALKVPQKGSSSHTTTNKSKLLTSERAPPPPPPPPAAHAAHAATDTAAHRCRTASTRNKKMADAHANPLKGRCVQRTIYRGKIRLIEGLRHCRGSSPEVSDRHFLYLTSQWFLTFSLLLPPPVSFSHAVAVL